MIFSKINSLKKGFADAEVITKRYAKTFYFASRFLPKDKKLASFSVYAICRLSDESVDNIKHSSLVESLRKAQNDIASVYSGVELRDDILLSFKNTVYKYKIPKQYFDELIEGMYMDINKKRYENFNELYDYCYKVAGVIGLIMLNIFGYKDSKAEKYAISLGIAMQLTNILRDIKEDYHRKRIYLPQDEMRSFGVTEDNIAEEKNTGNFRELLKFQIKRARQYYANAEDGIKMIDNLRSRFVICAIKDMYSGILDVIKSNDYDIFSKRAHINNIEKLMVALKVFLKAEFL